jgi:hypothetical protein
MTSNGEWPSSRNAYTPFEEELVNAMKDFANSADAPDFTPSTVMRGARRRTRPMIIAGVTALFILAGGGTALAVTASHTGNAGLHDRPVSATSHPAKGCSPSASATPVPAPATATPEPAGTAITPVPIATGRPAKGCGPSASAIPVPAPATATPEPAGTAITPVPAGTAATPAAATDSHPRSAAAPLVPATSSPVPVASRPGSGSGPSATRLPTPAARPANQ